MTNKTIEELLKDIEDNKRLGKIESKAIEIVTSVPWQNTKDRNKVMGLIIQALREQAAQTTLPSEEDFCAFVDHFYEQAKEEPSPMRIYHWIKDNTSQTPNSVAEREVSDE